MTDPLRIVTRDYMLRQVRSEYLEMPGLRLTRRQAQRLWGLDDDLRAAARFAGGGSIPPSPGRRDVCPPDRWSGRRAAAANGQRRGKGNLRSDYGYRG